MLLLEQPNKYNPALAAVLFLQAGGGHDEVMFKTSLNFNQVLHQKREAMWKKICQLQKMFSWH